MIVPLSLIGDISCRQTREFVMANFARIKIDCFPQKDNRARRVFRDAKLSTAIVLGYDAGHPTADQTEIRVFPGNSFLDQPLLNSISLKEVQLIDPNNIPIPMVSAETWNLFTSIHRSQRTKCLRHVVQISVTRGEINQKVYRAFIKADSRYSRLVKGVEIGRYHVQTTLSQGVREYFNERAFLRTHNEKSVVSMRRIALQRITGVDEKLRVVGCIIEPKAYFADSTNSVVAFGPFSLEYVLGVLNSRLTQWCFKVFSSNNNVGTNELLLLPIPDIDESNPNHIAQRDKLASLVKSMLDLYVRHDSAKNPDDVRILERQLRAADNAIDKLVYEMFNLNSQQIDLIEGRHESV